MKGTHITPPLLPNPDPLPTEVAQPNPNALPTQDVLPTHGILLTPDALQTPNTLPTSDHLPKPVAFTRERNSRCGDMDPGTVQEMPYPGKKSGTFPKL